MVGTSFALASPSASIESNLGNDDGSMRRERRMVSTPQPFETASLIVAIAAMTAMLPKQPSKIAAALNAGVDMTSSFANNDNMGMTLFGVLSIVDMGMNISTANNDDIGSDDDKAGLALLAATAAVSSPIVVFDEQRGGRESCNTVGSTLTFEAGQDECRDDSVARSESFTIAALAGVKEGGNVCCGTVASEIRIEGEECGNRISASRRNSSTVCGVKLSLVQEKNIAGSIKVSEV